MLKQAQLVSIFGVLSVKMGSFRKNRDWHSAYGQVTVFRPLRDFYWLRALPHGLRFASPVANISCPVGASIVMDRVSKLPPRTYSTIYNHTIRTSVRQDRVGY